VSSVNPCLEGVAPSWESLPFELAAEVLRDFGKLQLRAFGGSMLPAIFPGDVLLVRREAIGAIRRGHVVLFRRCGCFYAHRVVRIENHAGGLHLITRGDALAYEDFPTCEDDLLGRIPALIRRGRHIELAAAPNPAARIFQWAVKNSDLFASALLRWHLSKMRFAKDGHTMHPEMQWMIREGR
jgi:signal peptidase I